MTQDIFHFGVLVDDLDEAMRRFEMALGVTFATPMDRVLHVGCGDSTQLTDLRLAFSKEGPPFIELIQSQGSRGVWGNHHGEGLHHIGAWTDDLEGRIAQLESEGIRVEASLSIDGRMSAVYLEPDDLTGTRLELCARPSGEWTPPT